MATKTEQLLAEADAWLAQARANAERWEKEESAFFKKSQVVRDALAVLLGTIETRDARDSDDFDAKLKKFHRDSIAASFKSVEQSRKNVEMAKGTLSESIAREMLAEDEERLATDLEQWKKHYGEEVA